MLGSVVHTYNELARVSAQTARKLSIKVSCGIRIGAMSSDYPGRPAALLDGKIFEGKKGKKRKSQRKVNAIYRRRRYTISC